MTETIIVKNNVSSCVKDLAYSIDDKTLTVIMRNNAEYIYEGVEKEIFYLFQSAKSKGSFFNQYIKGEYVGHKL